MLTLRQLLVKLINLVSPMEFQTKSPVLGIVVNPLIQLLNGMIAKPGKTERLLTEMYTDVVADLSLDS